MRGDHDHWRCRPRQRGRPIVGAVPLGARQLGRSLWRSEVLAAMHGVQGVADVNLEILTFLPEPVTSRDLEVVSKTPIVQDIIVRPGSLDGTAGGKGAEIAFLWRDIPELIALSVIAS